jgi:hypothetical protein
MGFVSGRRVELDGPEVDESMDEEDCGESWKVLALR